jgi:hypothetical protein
MRLNFSSFTGGCGGLGDDEVFWEEVSTVIGVAKLRRFVGE